MQISAPPRLTNLSDAAGYLEGLINHERRPGFAYARLDLRPIEALLERLGRPQDGLSIIHVAGSKGKGSTCLFAESILCALGERVGTFTSPHLESWVERFRIDAEPIEAMRLVRAVEKIRPIVEELRAGPPETVPSFFDATTALAFLLFAEAGVDRALVEVGLGGRLDSTNVVDPAVTCITSIELEHTDKLGETEPEIAAEKAGILKPSRPAIIGALRPQALEVACARAAAVAASVRRLGEDFEVRASTDADGSAGYVFEEKHALAGRGREHRWRARFSLRAPGAVAAGNAALAIACVRALEAHEDAALVTAVRNGLSTCRLPARIEVLERDSRVVVDAAHTADSARALADALASIAPDGVELLLSVSSDKNLDALLDALLPASRRVWLTRAEPIRSLAPSLLAKAIRKRVADLPIELVEDPEEAARQARAALAPGLLLCATGSIYLAGIARRVLSDEAPR